MNCLTCHVIAGIVYCLSTVNCTVDNVLVVGASVNGSIFFFIRFNVSQQCMKSALSTFSNTLIIRFQSSSILTCEENHVSERSNTLTYVGYTY